MFKFVMKIFYGTIVVENTHLIPENGVPLYVLDDLIPPFEDINRLIYSVVCANHCNSLTDAL